MMPFSWLSAELFKQALGSLTQRSTALSGTLPPETPISKVKASKAVEIIIRMLTLLSIVYVDRPGCILVGKPYPARNQPLPWSYCGSIARGNFEDCPN